MQSPPFVTIRCPACGSADVQAREGGRFACGHCQSNFLYTGGRSVARSERVSSGGGVLVAVVSIVMLVFGGAVFVLFFAAGGSDKAPATIPSPVTSVQRDATPPTPIVARPLPSPQAVVAPPEIEAPAVPAIAPPPATEAGPPDLSSYQRLEGCACKASNPSDRVELYAHGSGRSTRISGKGMQITHHLEFVIATAGADPWRVPATSDTAPASSYTVNGITLGIGCNGDTVVIAAGTAVSAWSRKDRALLWTHTLAKPFGSYGDRAGNGLGLDCEMLRPAKDTISVRAGGRTVKLALADGTVR